MTRASLLDVNVLIALFDAGHVHHLLAHEWFADNRQRGWATCTLTENGLVRVVSNPKYGSNFERPGAVTARLKAMCEAGDHVWWTTPLSIRDERVYDLSAATHRQLTDIYLLGLAHVNGATLATFDRTIPVNTVIGATRDTLEVIAAEQ